MKKNLVIVFAITALFGTSCSNEVEMNSPLRKEEIYVEKTASRIQTRTASQNLDSFDSDNKDLFLIKYRDITLENIPLNIQEVNMLRTASSVSGVIPVSLKGYSEWTVRTEGIRGGNWYQLAISSKNKDAAACGIAPGIYIVRDIWLWQTYTLPTPMAIILSNYTYSDHAKMGRDPKDLSKPGFAWTLSGSTVTLKTAATLFKYAQGGEEVFLTYPVNSKNLEWNFSYITVQIN